MAAQSGIATFLGLRGDTPKAPPEINIDLDKIIADTISGNLTNLPAATSYASQANQAQIQNFQQYMEKLFPGYTANQTQIGQNISAELKGEVPQDVQRQLRDQAATQGVYLGTSGSQRNKFDYLRNYGLTSLDLTQRGLQNTLAWLSGPKAPYTNFTSLFLSPEFRANLKFQQEQVNTGIRWLRNQLHALPSKNEQAGAQILDFVASYAQSAASFGTGSLMGGGGGGSSGTWGGITSGPGSSNMPQYYGPNVASQGAIDWYNEGTAQNPLVGR